MYIRKKVVKNQKMLALKIGVRSLLVDITFKLLGNKCSFFIRQYINRSTITVPRSLNSGDRFGELVLNLLVPPLLILVLLSKTNIAQNKQIIISRLSDEWGFSEDYVKELIDTMSKEKWSHLSNINCSLLNEIFTEPLITKSSFPIWRLFNPYLFPFLFPVFLTAPLRKDNASSKNYEQITDIFFTNMQNEIENIYLKTDKQPPVTDYYNKINQILKERKVPKLGKEKGIFLHDKIKKCFLLFKEREDFHSDKNNLMTTKSVTKLKHPVDGADVKLLPHKKLNSGKCLHIV